MPAKDTTTIALGEQARADLRAVAALAESAGVQVRRSRGEAPSTSEVVRYALRFAAAIGGAKAALVAAPGPCAVPSPIRIARLAAGLTVAQLARAAHCSRSHIRAVECGHVSLAPNGKLAAWLKARAQQ